MTVVSNGQTLVVSSGIVGGIGVTSGGIVIVKEGGITSGAVLAGGDEYVSNGSEAITTKVQSGGELVISDGGRASGTKVQFSGTETISGGTDLRAVVSGHGAVQYLDVGRTTGTTVEHFGSQVVSSGGVAVYTVVLSGGSQTLLGGESKYAQIRDAYQTVSSGGVATSTTVKGGGQVISDGGRAQGTYIDGEGIIQVFSGGLSLDTVLSGLSIGGATEIVFKGGRSEGIHVLNGGEQFADGGHAIDAVIVAGGVQSVGAGGLATHTTISGGYEDIAKGGRSEGTVVLAGGSEYVDSGGVASNVSIEGGFMEVESGGTAIDPILTGPAGGTLLLYSGFAQVSGSITFAGGGESLQIAGIVMPTAVISGFAPTDTISLINVSYSPTDTISVTGNQLTLLTPSGNFFLDIAGASGEQFEVVSGTNGSTVLETKSPSAASPPFEPMSSIDDFNWGLMTSPDSHATVNPAMFLKPANDGGGIMSPLAENETIAPTGLSIGNHH